ncbi:MAG TPA: non-ribosomal peptide synthetase [Allosphingosinicella sp.]|nr:non-ribosomal peptide synthetase [Allosphingosinicella sp.]
MSEQSTAMAAASIGARAIHASFPSPVYPFVPAERVAAIAAATPDAIALSAACGSLSYGALDAGAARLAGLLRARGVGKGGLVAIGLERSFEQVTACLAVWKAGAAFLPLDPSWPEERLAALLEDSGCAAVIGRADLGLKPLLERPDFIALDGDAAEIAAFDGDTGSVPVSSDDLAYVIYTSGSTGTPKGVEISHANLSNLVAWHIAAFGVCPGDRGSHLAGLAFDASVWEIWPYLCAGGSVALAPDSVRTSADALQRWLVAEQINVAFAPTALAERLIALPWPEGTALRVLLTGADRLQARPPAGLPFRFVNNYGPTECTVVATSATVAPGSGEAGLPPIGRPIDNVQLHILDDAGEPVPDGTIGEAWIGGAGVGRGYRGRPDLARERFVPDRFGDAPGARLYRTGDLVARLADGQIAFHGRADDQVKIRGHRVEPEEVAAAIAGHPAVETSVVAARAGEGGHELVAWLLLAPGASPTGEEMRDFLAKKLPDYMMPAAFVRLDALPLNANGKIDRAALPAPGEDNRLGGRAFSAPGTPVEERLAEIIAGMLGRGPVGIDDNFFLLGGHSLLGTQVVLRASDAFGIDLTLRHLFQAPTIRTLAALIETLALELLEGLSDDEAQLRAAE